MTSDFRKIEAEQTRRDILTATVHVDKRRFPGMMINPTTSVARRDGVSIMVRDARPATRSRIPANVKICAANYLILHPPPGEFF